MRISNLACLAFILLPLAAVSETRANDATLVEEVRCVEIAFAESVADSDIDAFRELLHPDARFVGSGVVRGRDEIVAAWEPLFAKDRPLLVWRPEIVEVLDSGVLALSRGPYRLQVGDADGKLSEEWGTYNSIWLKQPDGAWQIVFDAGSPATEPPPENTRQLIEDAAPPCAASRQLLSGDKAFPMPARFAGAGF